MFDECLLALFLNHNMITTYTTPFLVCSAGDWSFHMLVLHGTLFMLGAQASEQASRACNNHRNMYHEYLLAFESL